MRDIRLWRAEPPLSPLRRARGGGILADRAATDRAATVAWAGRQIARPRRRRRGLCAWTAPKTAPLLLWLRTTDGHPAAVGLQLTPRTARVRTVRRPA